MSMKESRLGGMDRECSIVVAIYIIGSAWIIARLTWLYFLAFMSFGFTPDLPWLLKTGHYILAQGGLPAHDIFSWTAPDRPLIAYQWLFEVLLASLEKLVGLDAVIQISAFVGVVLYVIAPLALNARYRPPLFFALPLCVAAALLATYNLQVRPMLVTCAFLLLQFGLIERLRLGRIRLKVLIPATVFYYMLWGNMHMLVLFGLGSLGLFAWADAMQRAGAALFDPPEPDLEGQPIAWRVYAMLMGASVIGSLLNPYGYGIYSHLFETVRDAGAAHISELNTPDFHTVRMQFFTGLLLLFILLMARARTIFAVHEVLHVLAFSLASLYSGRFVVWAALFFALILPRALQRLTVGFDRDRYRAIRGTLLITEPQRAKIITVYLAISVLFTLIAPRFLESPMMACSSYAPVIKAYQALKQDTDRLFNDDAMGSCMILYQPVPKVFIDTRFDFYSGEHSAKWAKAIWLGENWKEVLGEWDINTFVLRKGLPLTELLSVMPEYESLYEDGVARIYRLRAGSLGNGFNKKSP